MLVFKKLIVGIDFGEVSERAVKTALLLAKPLGAEVVLVHVIPAVASYADPARFVAEVRPAIEEQLRDWVERLGWGRSQQGQGRLGRGRR